MVCGKFDARYETLTRRLAAQKSAAGLCMLTSLRSDQHSDGAGGSSTADAGHRREHDALGAIAPALRGIAAEEVPVAKPADQ